MNNESSSESEEMGERSWGEVTHWVHTGSRVQICHYWYNRYIVFDHFKFEAFHLIENMSLLWEIIYAVPSKYGITALPIKTRNLIFLPYKYEFRCVLCFGLIGYQKM